MANIGILGLPWDKFYRIDFLRDAGLVNDITCKAFEDYLFNVQAFNQAKGILGMPYCGYYYRQSVAGSAFTRGYNPNQPQYSYDSICKLDSYIRNHKLQAEMIDTLRSLSIHATSVAMNCYYLHPGYDKNHRARMAEFNEMKK